MWQDFIRQLSPPTKRGESNQSQFQACKIAIPFTWGVSTNQPYTLEYWNFCNQLLHWSDTNVYFPSSGDFVGSYESWLNQLTQNSGLDSDYINQVQKAHEKLDVHASDLTNQFSTYRKSTANSRSVPKTFSEWDSGNSQEKLGKLKNDIDTLVQQKASLNRGPLTDYAEVWAAFNESSNFRFYVDSNYHIYNKRIYNWAESPITMQPDARSGRRAKAPVSVRIEVNTGQESSTKQRTNSASSELPFLRSMIGEGILPVNKRGSESPAPLSGELKFEDTQEIEVSPSSNWFIEYFLNGHLAGPYNNPNVVGFGSQASGNQTYFFDGQKAILPSYISSITIGYNPSFSLSGDDQNLSLINKAVNETGGILLGPISFKNEKGVNQIDMSNRSNNVICSSNNVESSPQIIGVNLRFFHRR
jgi:hypothetical protein